VQRNATVWEEVIDEIGLEVGTDGQPTYYSTREDDKGKSVIDSTLAHRPITNWFILADDHSTGSDHEIIEWEVDANWLVEADHERVVGWNLAAMMDEDAKAAEKLWAELPKESSHLDVECTEDGVEQEAAWCQEAISSILNAATKEIRLCAKSKRLGIADIKERRNVVGREKGRSLNSEEVAWAKAEL